MKKIELKSFWKALGGVSAFIAAMITASPVYAAYGEPVPGGMGIPEPASPMKEKMIAMHDNMLMPIITVICLFVLALLVIVIVRFNKKANPVPSRTTHNLLLEVVWTLVPILILAVVAVPSLKMLYYVDKTTDAEMTLKVTGFQWYWGYEYLDNGNVSFMSNMVQDKDLKPGQPRLLATDNPVVLPVDTNIKILTTASDVIHSWAVPAFGIKIDAIPGRLNETWVRIDKEGTFYGQCSQLCGANHAYMPVEVKAVSKAAFAEWIKKQGGKMPAPKGEEAPAAKTESKKTGEKQ